MRKKTFGANKTTWNKKKHASLFSRVFLLRKLDNCAEGRCKARLHPGSHVRQLSWFDRDTYQSLRARRAAITSTNDLTSLTRKLEEYRKGHVSSSGTRALFKVSQQIDKVRTEQPGARSSRATKDTRSTKNASGFCAKEMTWATLLQWARNAKKRTSASLQLAVLQTTRARRLFEQTQPLI